MRPDQPLHRYVLRRLNEFIDCSEQHFESRHGAYDDIEMLWLNYVDPDSVDDDGQPKNPNKRAVVVPFTYAACQTVVSHIYSAYTSRPVLLPLRALPPEHDRAAEALEAVLEAKHLRDLTSVRLFAWIQDAIKYGQGRLQSNWESKRELVTETIKAPVNSLLGLWPAHGQRTRQVERVVSEGPVNYNIPPRDYLPDPRVPSWDPQQGEFVGVRMYRSRSYLKQRQREGVYFNVDRIPSGAEVDRATGHELVDNMLPLAGEGSWPASDEPVQLHQIEVRLCPGDWKAEDETTVAPRLTPEVWAFTVANRSTVIQAERIPNRHGKFRVAVMDGALDAHALLSPSHVEIVRGVQEYCDFAYNSRMANIRLGLLQALVYNPELVEEEDIFTTQAGMRIRLKPGVDGRIRSMQEAVQQLPVQDVTAQLVNDVGLSGQLIQKALGVTDTLHGEVSPVARSATEMSGVIQSARTRVGQLGSLMWDQGVTPWGMLEISDAQQFMSEEGYFRLSGKHSRHWPNAQHGRSLIGPRDIQGEIEIAPVDVTMPINPMAEGQLWMQLAMQVAQNQRLDARYNSEEMFEEGARRLGASNIQDFRRSLPPMGVNVMPDERLVSQVQQGNLIPQPAAGNPLAALLQAGGA